jgi:hypothetical protein
MYYGLSPLYLPLEDIVSLDDQGDLWYAVAQGHAEWSIWASLAAGSAVALSGSSTYNWEDDKDVLLNSLILGIPGAVLPIVTTEAPRPGKPSAAGARINRRWAADTWYRKTTSWRPRWYDSYPGGLDRPPQLKCWGREETIGGKKEITALILRQVAADSTITIEGIHWSGDWALIAQDDNDVRHSHRLALIPFDAGKIVLPFGKKPTSVQQYTTTAALPYSNWNWSNGQMAISVTKPMLDKMTGFLILSN